MQNSFAVKEGDEYRKSVVWKREGAGVCKDMTASCPKPERL
jgi:hypothetical protein